MKLILKSMKQHSRALIASKPLRICLIACAVSACGKVPKFPTDRIWETSTVDNVCGEYKVTDTEKMQVKHVKDWPLSKCNGVFGFSTSDVPKVMKWGEKTQDYINANCK